VNTLVGSRRELVANSVHTADADATQLSASAVCIGLKKVGRRHFTVADVDVEQARMTFWSAVTLCILVLAINCLPMMSSLPRRMANRRWYIGGRPINPSPGVRVRVSPRSATMHYGDTTSFRCTARGGSAIIDMPFIKFSVRRLSGCIVLSSPNSITSISVAGLAENRFPTKKRLFGAPPER